MEIASPMPRVPPVTIATRAMSDPFVPVRICVFLLFSTHSARETVGATIWLCDRTSCYFQSLRTHVEQGESSHNCYLRFARIACRSSREYERSHNGPSKAKTIGQGAA